MSEFIHGNCQGNGIDGPQSADVMAGRCRRVDGAPAAYCSTRAGEWVKLMREFVRSLQFGEVHLTVHKGRVVEVRKVQKFRFDEV